MLNRLCPARRFSLLILSFMLIYNTLNCLRIVTLSGTLIPYKSYKSFKFACRRMRYIYFSNFDINSYPYRYTLLSDSITTDSVILWIDALGAEWLSLLCWTLQKDNNGQIKSVALAQSCLPTETEYNDQWNKMDTTA